MLINTSSLLIKVMYGNKISRLILSLLPILLYYNLAKGMSKKKSSRLDFLSGNIIVLISIIFFLLAFIIHKSDLFTIGIGASNWKFPLDIFLMPGLFITEMLKIQYGPLAIAFASLMPGFIYGISIKKSRAKLNKKMRMRKNIDRQKRNVK